MENEKNRLNELIDDMKEFKKSLARSKKIKQELFDLINEQSIKQKIPDEIIIYVDFQVW